MPLLNQANDVDLGGPYETPVIEVRQGSSKVWPGWSRQNRCAVPRSDGGYGGGGPYWGAAAYFGVPTFQYAADGWFYAAGGGAFAMGIEYGFAEPPFAPGLWTLSLTAQNHGGAAKFTIGDPALVLSIPAYATGSTRYSAAGTLGSYESMISGATGPNVGDALYWKDVLLEFTGVQQTYFDGSSADSWWMGQPWKSESRKW